MLSLLGDWLNLFSTRHCAVCGEPLSPGERSVCGGCLVAMPYMHIEDFRTNPVCRLFWGKFPIERAHCYLKFHGEVRQMLHQLKYQHRMDVGREMGRIMASVLMPHGFFNGIDCIVPVPLHWIRHFRRGYNQSLELARGVAEVTGIPVLRCQVVRVRNNSSQTRMSATERIGNTQGLFRCRTVLPNRHVLIIDDVLTTGSTITACAQAILQKNPETKFSILTLAKA